MSSQTPTAQQSNLCPACDSHNTGKMLDIPQLPIHSNLLWSSRQEALDAPRGDLCLRACRECGHIFNAAFDPARMEYSQEYDNSLHFSPRFQQYAVQLAADLIERHNLHQKDVIEIGCGKGDFLRMICEQGKNRGVGFDPSYVRQRDEETASEPLKFIQDFYSERYAEYQADLLCCRHVLEHIQHPREFVATIRRAIGERYDTAVYFEVPNSLFMLKDLSVWDFIYEHCGYFCQCSLAEVFRAGGFRIKHIQEMFQGQFLGLESVPGEPADVSAPADCEYLDRVSAYVSALSEKYRQKIREWRHRLDNMQQDGVRAVVWGAGSKGVTFLNTLDIRENLRYIVDINPHKHGKYVAGSGQKIVAANFLYDYQPQTVIVMNPIYLREIQRTLQEMNVASECVVV